MMVDEKCVQSFSRKTCREGNLQDLDIDGRSTVTWVLKKYVVRWTGRVWFRIRTSDVIWERCNESYVFHMCPGGGDLVII